MLCHYCNKREATHFCAKCEHWICANPICLLQSGITIVSKQIDKVVDKVDTYARKH